MVQAARHTGVPIVISFTVETDGRLPSGGSLGAAIETVDQATANGPLYYMINCAHPSHFLHRLPQGEAWLQRIRAVRANASGKSDAELDESPTLDSGNPLELADQFRQLQTMLPNLNVPYRGHLRRLCP